MSGVLPFRLLFAVKLPAGYNLEQIVTKSGEVKTAVSKDGGTARFEKGGLKVEIEDAPDPGFLEEFSKFVGGGPA